MVGSRKKFKEMARKEAISGGGNKDSFDAELWAISDALGVSIKILRNENPTTVTVFTDSHTAIAKILEPKVRLTVEIWHYQGHKLMMSVPSTPTDLDNLC